MRFLDQAISEPNPFPYKYPNKLIPVILSAYTAYEGEIECSETSEYKIQTPGNHPKVRIQRSEHGESLKSRITHLYFKTVRIFSVPGSDLLCSALSVLTQTKAAGVHKSLTPSHRGY
jgi:hypothetical protein